MDASSIDERTVPHPREDLAAVDIGGEFVLHDPALDAIRHLGPAETVVWRCLDGEASVAEIAGDTVTVLGVEREAATADLLRFVRRFARAGLLDGPLGHEPEPASRAARRRKAATRVTERELITVPPDE